MKSKVLIAGAGIGGLTAACCLAESGFEVALFEQVDRLGEIGAGIQVSANAFHVLSHLGLGQHVEKIGVRPDAYVFRLHDTGEEVGRFALGGEHVRLNGAPYCQLHRADLHDLLARKAKDLGVAIHLSSRVESFEDSGNDIAIRFSGGEVAHGDVLVGADGIKSTVRNQLLGASKAVYTGDAAWRLTIPSRLLPDDFMPPVMSVWMGPGAHIVCYYIRGARLLNFVGIVETDEVSEESWNARFPWARLKSDFVGWHPDIQKMIDAADPNECFRWSLFYRPPIEVWSGDRVTMLGDAVHATLPYLAQGAAMAIEDGAVLGRALVQAGSIRDGLKLYERNRIERTAKVVSVSGKNRDLFHMRDQVALKAAFKNRDEGAARNAWLYSYNALTTTLT